MPKINIIRYIVPIGLLITMIVVMSCIVTSCKCSGSNVHIEHFNTNSSENMSLEKLTPFIKHITGLYTHVYPLRKSIITQDVEVGKKWEDLTENKNDISIVNSNNTSCWNFEKGFNLDDSNFFTKPIQKYELDKEWSIIIHYTIHTMDSIDDVVDRVPSVAEQFANEEESDKTQTTTSTIILDDENETPPKIKNAIGLTIPGKDKKNIDIEIAKGVGKSIIYINNDEIGSFSSDDVDVFLYMTYSNKKLSVYANDYKVLEQEKEIVLDNESPINFNKDRNLYGIGLKTIIILNKSLDKKELNYFTEPTIVVKSIMEHHTSTVEKIQEYTETCTSKCTKTTCVSDCVNYEKRKCPSIYIDSNKNYIINDVNYGNNRRIAKEIYKINYPTCNTIPDEIEDWYNREIQTIEESPFLVQSELHPMKYHECENTQWKEGMNYDTLNNKCKNRIDSYCYENSELDPFCSCWKSENADLPECRKFRATFNNPRDRGCSSSDFSIEEHPDFHKYVQKDKIPCWGCSLD